MSAPGWNNQRMDVGDRPDGQRLGTGNLIEVGRVGDKAHVSAPVNGRMRLRQLTSRDAPVIASWAEDIELCRAADWSVDLPYERHLAFWRDLIGVPPPGLIRLGAVSGGDLVGYVDLHRLDPARRELGFLIGVRARWGEGLGRQAAAAALEHGFCALRLEEIWAEALEANQRSVRLLQRLGMRETGRGDEGEFLGQTSFYRQFTLTSSLWRRQPNEPGG